MARGRAAVERPGLDEVVAGGIREQILSGALCAGKHLVEADLAEQYSVSNGTVRSAFRHLQTEGLVVFRPRRGMFVAGLDAADALELCSLRNALEALAAELAAENLTPEGGAELCKIMDDMRHAVARRDRRDCMETDIAFHRHIVSMSSHKRLMQMYGLLDGQIRLFMVLTEPMHEDLFADMVPIHGPIAQAILDGDAETASSLSASHNKADGEALAKHVSNDGEGNSLRMVG